MLKENNQFRTPIIDQLRILGSQPDAAFYAPGHKRGQGINPLLGDLLGNQVFKADLPELPELDNLFTPTGVIAEAQSLAAIAFGARQTWFLVNGSTCGIMAAILATCRQGDKIILPRNVHRSVIAGLIVSGAVPVFIQPDYDQQWDLVSSVSPEAIALAVQEHADAKAVLVVYPTYQGICTDLAAIVQLTQQHQIPLIVDEAHGAHLHFHPDLPPSGLSLGADICIQSAHKTLGALSQASLLHLQGDRLHRDTLNQALSLLQSTSPSYLLLASLDAARQQMALHGEQLLSHTLNLAQDAKNQLHRLSRIVMLTQKHLPHNYRLDATRLTVFLGDLPISGYEADTFLRQKYSVTAELPLETSLTFILSIGNTHLDIQQLILSLQGLEENYSQKRQEKTRLPYLFPILTQVLTPRETFFASTRIQPLTQSVGEISAELICPYPPGIPVLMPGEKITREAIAYLLEIKNRGGIITGCQDESLTNIAIVIS
jgi:arginine/lysine/ornithine decarboxylase